MRIKAFLVGLFLAALLGLEVQYVSLSKRLNGMVKAVVVVSPAREPKPVKLRAPSRL